MAKRDTKRTTPEADTSPWLFSVIFKPFDAVEPDPKNARVHPRPEIDLLKKSLLRSGWYAPLVEGNGLLRIGHGRLIAAKELLADGKDIPGAPSGQAPVVDRSDLTEEQLRALALADNRLPEMAEWDTSLLAEGLDFLAAADFDITTIGFSAADLGKVEKVADSSLVTEIPTSMVEDRFWISVRGPLSRQAAALQALRAVMKDIPEVTVELGTVSVDG